MYDEPPLIHHSYLPVTPSSVTVLLPINANIAYRLSYVIICIDKGTAGNVVDVQLSSNGVEFFSAYFLNEQHPQENFVFPEPGVQCGKDKDVYISIYGTIAAGHVAVTLGYYRDRMG